MIKNFAELKERLKNMPVKRRVAVAPAQDLHTLQAVMQAARDEMVEPVLIGSEAEIRKILQEIGAADAPVEIIEEKDPVQAVQKAADLARAGQVDCLMKGRIETGPFMKVLVNKEHGIRKNETMSLVAFMESPYYHKVFGITDVALLMYPDKAQKIAALKNAAAAFHALGIEQPKAAIITAIEKVNPKMPETVEAAEIKAEGVPGCIIEGPISYDLAMDAEAARIKGYQSPVAGEADILLMKDIVCGNVAAKTITVLGGGQTGGVVLGALVPILLVSRAASAADKYMSIVMAALVGRCV